ncbi:MULTISPECIES: helix-turn-helix domain-containing protein [Brucella]|uniref:Helix-turn-helix domain protein n=1 Tax=Brucella lupini TaxID=255457 RepID=A0A256GBY0_9HYPH|nr:MULTISPECIES: helix-turn-helix domain-containing protein [Brucella]RNL46390.1 helix-turn-helix domain-containing protein [Ochrobactrum sp. MH181795]KAB2706415.1 helix-turn-helix domain-containing protein [Brucella lupini]KAB2725695.1 helix-turn-helix domain-containing protein [Brucella anthropi]KAB2743005.1 helix-turn-helix domain-containing protein [Brucella anthropi]KAB2748246.1 helix-turn-helix domain-containing protein [Brucella anthropi]
MSDNFVPTYELYGEESEQKPDFWLHCETLFSRSSLHNFEISLHRHESFFQLLYIEGGTGQVSFDGAIHPFQTPCAIMVPPGFNHGFAFSRDIVGHIVTILSPHMPFIGDGSGGVMAKWLMQPQLILMKGAGNENLALLSSLLRQVQDEFHTRKPYKNSLLESLVQAAFVYVLRHAYSSKLVEQEDRQIYGHARIERLQELIDRHYREHRPVSFYAKLLGVSSTHLNRTVKQLTGRTTQDMVASRLIETAKRDLIAMPSSVQHIAYSLGFSDPAYFSRFFLKMTSETPRTFRLRERERLAALDSSS